MNTVAYEVGYESASQFSREFKRFFGLPPRRYGESWAEPRFGRVKTSDSDTTGTPVFFIGGGFSADNTTGKAVLAINVLTGAVVKKFYNDGYANTDMNYSIPSTVNLIDENDNGFVDKVYVGDLGGQLLELGIQLGLLRRQLGQGRVDHLAAGVHHLLRGVELLVAVLHDTEVGECFRRF